jgi:hypothetical protein
MYQATQSQERRAIEWNAIGRVRARRVISYVPFDASLVWSGRGRWLYAHNNNIMMKCGIAKKKDSVIIYFSPVGPLGRSRR